MKVGDRVKLNYKGFDRCPKGTIVKIESITKDETYIFIYKGITYHVADFELIPLKEEVRFT